MADKYYYIEYKESSSPAREEYYTKRTQQLEYQQRTKPLRAISKINVRSPRFNFSGSIVVRIFAFVFFIILLSALLRTFSMPTENFSFPTLHGFLTYLQNMPQLNLQGIINVPSFVTGVQFFDQVFKYFSGLFNGIFNVIAFLLSTFINILNISSYFFSWIFGISFFG